MKHTSRAVFFLFCLFVTTSQGRTLFFQNSDTLRAVDHYTCEKVVQGKKVSVQHVASTSMVDFTKDTYTEVSPFLIKTGAFKKIMSIKVMKYSFFERFRLDGKEYFEQSTGYFLIDSSAIVPIRQITVRSNVISNEYYDFNVSTTIPLLKSKNYANTYSEREFKYADLFTEEQLFWLVRFMAEMRIDNKKIYLLPPMVHGLFNEKVSFAEIQFTKEYFLLQGVKTQKVLISREDGKKAELWISSEASRRVFKATNFLGGWYELEKSTVEPFFEWPF